MYLVSENCHCSDQTTSCNQHQKCHLQCTDWCICMIDRNPIPFKTSNLLQQISRLEISGKFRIIINTGFQQAACTLRRTARRTHDNDVGASGCICRKFSLQLIRILLLFYLLFHHITVQGTDASGYG